MPPTVVAKTAGVHRIEEITSLSPCIKLHDASLKPETKFIHMHFSDARYVLQSIKTMLSYCQLVYKITKKSR